MRASIVAVCAVILAGAFYFYQQHLQSEYRRGALAEIDVVALEIATAQIKEINSRAISHLDDDGNRRDLKKLDEDIRAARVQLDSAVAKFYALERRIKDDHKGELPGWVKDSRSWQGVDAKIKR